MLATEAPEAEISQSPKGAAAAAPSPKGTLPTHPDQFARRHIGPGAEAQVNRISTPWTLTVLNSTISNNTSGDAGGGAYTEGHGTVRK